MKFILYFSFLIFSYVTATQEANASPGKYQLACHPEVDRPDIFSKPDSKKITSQFMGNPKNLSLTAWQILDGGNILRGTIINMSGRTVSNTEAHDTYPNSFFVRSSQWGCRLYRDGK